MIYNGTLNGSQCIESVSTSSMIPRIGQINWSESRYGNSYVRARVESWYFDHIINYQEYLEDTTFCDDSDYSNGNVSVNCSEEGSYSLAKGNIAYPVGLITAHEANLVGLNTSSENRDIWAHSDGGFWTMTSSTSDYFAWYVTSFGKIGYSMYNESGSRKNYFDIRPVIALSPDVVFNEGNGTASSPYIPSID